MEGNGGEMQIREETQSTRRLKGESVVYGNTPAATIRGEMVDSLFKAGKTMEPAKVTQIESRRGIEAASRSVPSATAYH